MAINSDAMSQRIKNTFHTLMHDFICNISQFFIEGPLKRTLYLNSPGQRLIFVNIIKNHMIFNHNGGD